MTLEDWNRMLAVNATGTFLCTREFVPAMIERGCGRVVNVASVAGLEGGKYVAALQRGQARGRRLHALGRARAGGHAASPSTRSARATSTRR